MLFICSYCKYSTNSNIRFEGHQRRKSPCSTPFMRKQWEEDMAYIMTIVRNKVYHFFEDNHQDKKLTFTEMDYTITIAKCHSGSHGHAYYEDFHIIFDGTIKGKRKIYNFFADRNAEGILKNRIN